MRIAVLFSGMPRYIERANRLMKNFFSGYEVDYFCHAWLDKNKKFEEKSWSDTAVKIDSEAEEKIINLYKPKKYLIEPQKQFIVPRYYAFNTGWKQPWFIPYSHFYSVKTANQLRLSHEKETGVKYDIVIKTRYDFFVGNKIKWESYDLSKLYLHNNCNCWYDLYDDLSFNDMFAFSNPENMNIYCDTFDNLDKIYRENFTRFSCESLLAFHLISNNIDVVPLSFNRAFLVRENISNELTFGSRQDYESIEKMAH
jgi:hypothetical protein